MMGLFMNPWVILGLIVAFAAENAVVFYKGLEWGAEKIQVEWDKDKTARIARTTGLVLQQQEVADRIASELATEKARNNARLVEVVAAVPKALGPSSTCVVRADLVRLHNDSVRAGPPAEAPSSPSGPDAPAPASTSDTTLGVYAAVCEENVVRHNACVAQVLKWQAFYTNLRTPRP